MSQTSLASGPIPQMDWKKARSGGYTADEYFLIRLTIHEEGANGGPGSGYLYQGMRPLPLNGWIVVLVPDRIFYFERGMTVYFWANYLQSVEVELVNQNTGKFVKTLAPVMRAKLWGIRAVK
ncbi:MAG: hypothetical protein IMZ69_07125 [Spirochaetes bacterium]|nr:hypothetical protein [Spirochaetota bacterium]